MQSIFQKQQSQWSQQQVERVQQFLKGNSFFSKIYEHKYIHELIKMTYYLTISAQQPVYLCNNKRPAAVIILSGTIAVYKKSEDIASNKKKRKHNQSLTQQLSDISFIPKIKSNKQQYVKVKQLVSFNDTIKLNCECKLVSMHGATSKCIFVPSFMYNQYLKATQQKNKQATYEMLNKIFKIKEKRPIMKLAESGCEIRQFKINNYVYRESDPVQSIFIILDGAVKIGEPDKLNKSSTKMRVVSVNSTFGEKDFGFQSRQENAICCSSHLRLLQIPKDSFLKFAKSYLPSLYSQLSPQISSRKKSDGLNHKKHSLSISLRRQQSSAFDRNKLPTIFRYRSAMRNQQDDERQYKLIKNSHILLDASPPRLNKIRSKSSLDEIPKDIMYKRSKLFKKIRPNAHPIDLTHRIC